MWWSGVIEAISNPVTQWVKNRGEVKKAKHTRELAIIDNQSRLALSESEYNHNWEMESLRGNSKWLRVICFVQLALPLNISIISPEHGTLIWANLDLVPAWFVQLYAIVIGSIWGIHEMKAVAPHVIGAIAKIGNKK